MSDDEDVGDEDLMELFDAAIEEVAEQSDVNPNVYYWDVEAAIKKLDGLHQVLFLNEKQRKERGLRPAGHTMEDLRDMPDYVSLEALVEAEYGEVRDRRWIDGLEMEMDTDFGIEFYGGVYLVDDGGLQEYIIAGSKQKKEGVSLGDELSSHPISKYADIDEVLQDTFKL